jgi:hypothetical protein
MRKEFAINDLLSVRLNPDTGKTEVYVGGELFRQCKYILLVSPNETIGKEINSIDEAAELMSHALEEGVTPAELGITPLEEFQAYCSNLQAWAEHGYDARLLHSNLAFPLLEKLASEGDTLAKAEFNKQVTARFAEGTGATRQFILEQGYLEHLTEEELSNLFDDISSERNIECLLILDELAGELGPLGQERFNRQVAGRFAEGTRASRQFIVEQDYLDLFSGEERLALYDEILCERDAKALRRLYEGREGEAPLYSYDERYFFTETNGTLRSLVFKLSKGYHLHLPDYDHERVLEAIFSLKDLRSLKLSSNYFTALPERFGELEHLQKLKMVMCKDLRGSLKMVTFLIS